jgi:sugar-specific transcriptional regulator TrmB
MWDGRRMSLKRLLETFEGFGLNNSDAKIYVYLAKKGPQRAQGICADMKLTKQRVYLCLKNLQNKGIVNSTLEHPALFAAVSVEKALDMLKNQKIGEEGDTHRNKAELNSAWQSMMARERP